MCGDACSTCKNLARLALHDIIVQSSCKTTLFTRIVFQEKQGRNIELSRYNVKLLHFMVTFHLRRIQSCDLCDTQAQLSLLTPTYFIHLVITESAQVRMNRW